MAKKKTESIIHNKADGTCYLCMKLNGDYDRRSVLEEHHEILGNHGRSLSEKYGLKVYLCAQHHREGPEAVHTNEKNRTLLKQEAQKAFEKKYSYEEWMKVFGRNYL